MPSKKDKLLHPRAKACVPNKTVQAMELSDATPLALKLFLLVAHEWEQRLRKADNAQPILTLNLQDLSRALLPNSPSVLSTGDYRNLKEALTLLSKVQIRRSYPNASGKRFHHIWLTLLPEIYFDEEPGVVSFVLSDTFRRAMLILEQEGFTLIPLRPAFLLHDNRHLRLFFLACRIENLRSEGARTFEVQKLSEMLGLDASYYQNWNRLRDKLLGYMKAVKDATGFEITMCTVKEGRKVVAVRLGVVRHDNLALQ